MFRVFLFSHPPFPLPSIFLYIFDVKFFVGSLVDMGVQFLIPVAAYHYIRRAFFGIVPLFVLLAFFFGSAVHSKIFLWPIKQETSAMAPAPTPSQMLPSTPPKLCSFQHTLRPPVSSAEGLFGGACLGVKGADCVVFFDWDEGVMIRKIDVVPKEVWMDWQ